jgi:hypothetical protein
MFTDWVSLVSSRMKSDYQISVTAVYNTFPFPPNLNEKIRARIASSANEVLEARSKFPNTPLATLYEPLTMPVDLVKAHDRLDSVVCASFTPRQFASSGDRQAYLLELYAELSATLLTPEKKTRKKKT